MVYWELIDSASSLAKGPAMVLSLCPACSVAGGVGRAHKVWREDGDLAGGHGAKKKGGGVGRRLELKEMDSSQGRNLHQR